MTFVVNGKIYTIIDTTFHGFIVHDEEGNERNLARDERGIWRVVEDEQ